MKRVVFLLMLFLLPVPLSCMQMLFGLSGGVVPSKAEEKKYYIQTTAHIETKQQALKEVKEALPPEGPYTSWDVKLDKIICYEDAVPRVLEIEWCDIKSIKMFVMGASKWASPDGAARKLFGDEKNYFVLLEKSGRPDDEGIGIIYEGDDKIHQAERVHALILKMIELNDC